VDEGAEAGGAEQGTCSSGATTHPWHILRALIPRHCYIQLNANFHMLVVATAFYGLDHAGYVYHIVLSQARPLPILTASTTLYCRHQDFQQH
jgi:hypothetical protein